MIGNDETHLPLYSYINLEDRVAKNDPLRKIQEVLNEVLAGLRPEFERLYSKTGRRSIPPERLIRASLLQVLFSIRSERQLMYQVHHSNLYRWFIGMGIDDDAWDPTVFSKNRERLLNTEIARKVMAGILEHPKVAPLLSDEHFSVDGTLIKAWASMKSFRPKDEGLGGGSGQDEADDGPKPRRGRNAEVDFKGVKRANATHESTTDPDARLFKKSRGAAAKLCFMGHAMTENRFGLVVEAAVTHASGYAERMAALAMLDRHGGGSNRRRTVGADKAYDAADFVDALRQRRITPHVAQNARGSAIDGRTTRHKGYATSLRKRKLVEEPFGWAKTIGGMDQTLHRGLERVEASFIMTMVACNLVRLPKLLAI